jgi:transcriptional regulator with XRE-family HTH domain
MPRNIAAPASGRPSSPEGSALGHPSLDTSRGATPDLARTVGANLRQIRRARGLSLEGLSSACGVSRAMLSQVELGKSAPTINVVSRIVRALGLPLSSLLGDLGEPRSIVVRASAAKLLTSPDGRVVSRSLSPEHGGHGVEFHEVRLAPRSIEQPDPMRPTARKHLVVTEGEVAVTVGGQRYQLEKGDAIVFAADCPHAYVNDAPSEARIYLVVVHENVDKTATPR